jgi:protein-arginine kinase
MNTTVISAAFRLAPNLKDHLTILLRNNEDKKQLGSRIPFDLPALISAINYLRNFKVLKLVKNARAKVEFVCLLSIIYTVCFTTSDV